MSSSPVPLKTRHVGQRCTLNLSRAETSSRGCGVVVRIGVLAHLTMVQNEVAKSPRVAEQLIFPHSLLMLGRQFVSIKEVSCEIKPVVALFT
ncbi:hypothetical protein TNCV_4770341 [Trichonephila clavipes]|nr:hypothetical protein TNCV_4770341 [Trichonephila clavipes]